MNTINQSAYHDEQNNTIDIEKIYNDYIIEIDSARSTANISNDINASYLKTLNKGSLSKIGELVKIEREPQESRCHAFFRLIGFPVVENGLNRYYNPGHDIIISNNKNITLDMKIDIANNPIEGFRELSYNREIYHNNFLNIFAQSGGIAPSVLSLTLVEGRKFNVPMLNANPFDMESESPNFIAGKFGYVGKRKVPFIEYTDQNGAKVQDSLLQTNRFHYIKPFMVDPRIDFTVFPLKNRVAVPFVKNKSQLKIGIGSTAKRPLIEKIIRDRLTVENKISTIGSSSERNRDYILSVDSIKDEPLIKQMTGENIYKTGVAFQFNKYFNIIRAICVELVNAQITIRRIQSKYYWLPVPSIKGPEGGVSVRNLIISKNLGTKLITKSDLSLINATLKNLMGEVNPQISDKDTSPDRGDFAFGRFETTFDGTDTEALGNNIENTVEHLSMLRTKEMKDAGKALKTIEIIMGDFSGLGLCDIIAVIGALHIMPENDLLGFLDEDAFSRMLIELNKQRDGISNPGISVAMESFSSKVLDLYNLMDKIYIDVASKNQLV